MLPSRQVGELVPAAAGHREVAVPPAVPRLPTAQSPTRRTVPGGRSAAGRRSGSGTGTPSGPGQRLALPRAARPDACASVGSISSVPLQEVAVRRLFVVLGVSALLVLTGGPALAERAVPARRSRSSTRPACCGDEAQVEDALEELQAEDGIQLFVVFVDSFDGADGRRVGCRRPPSCPSSGGNDALLAVAVDDRRVRLLRAGRLPAVRRPRSTSWPARTWSRSSARVTGPAASSRSPTSCAPARRRGAAADSGGGGRAARRRRRSPSSVAAPTWSPVAAAQARGAAARR